MDNWVKIIPEKITSIKRHWEGSMPTTFQKSQSPAKGAKGMT